MKALAALVTVIAGLASAPPRESPQDRQVSRSCNAILATVQNVVGHAATTQVQGVTGHFRALTPGTLTGEVVFNPTGSSINTAGDPSRSAFGCAASSSGAGVPAGLGRSLVVSTVREKFTRRGLYTLTIQLSAEGRRILARLGARDRAYRKRHPHGHKPPTIAFGVGFTYVPTG